MCGTEKADTPFSFSPTILELGGHKEGSIKSNNNNKNNNINEIDGQWVQDRERKYSGTQ